MNQKQETQDSRTPFKEENLGERRAGLSVTALGLGRPGPSAQALRLGASNHPASVCMRARFIITRELALISGFHRKGIDQLGNLRKESRLLDSVNIFGSL